MADNEVENTWAKITHKEAQILKIITETDEPITEYRLSKEFGIPRSTCHEYLKKLEEGSFLDSIVELEHKRGRHPYSVTVMGKIVAESLIVTGRDEYRPIPESWKDGGLYMNLEGVTTSMIVGEGDHTTATTLMPGGDAVLLPKINTPAGIHSNGESIIMHIPEICTECGEKLLEITSGKWCNKCNQQKWWYNMQDTNVSRSIQPSSAT